MSLRKLALWQKNLYTVWAIQILCLAGFGFGLPFLPFYIQEMGVTDPDTVKQWTGWMASGPGLTMGIMAPIWGMLADRYGRKLMLIRATVSGTIIISAMGLVGTPGALLTLRIIQGMFTGTVSAAATLVASGTPKERSGYALGFLSSSTFIGFSLGPLFGGIAAEKLGYRYSFFIGGAILLIATLLSLFLIRELHEGEEKKRGDKTDRTDYQGSFLCLLKPLVPFFLLLVCLRMARTMPSSYLPLRIQEMRNSLDGASLTMGYISSLAGLATAVAGITLGKLGDRSNKLNLIILCSLGAFLLELPTGLSDRVGTFALFYILLALAAGGVEPQLQSLISINTPASRRGAVFGMQTAAGSLGWALSPLLGSAISIRWNLRALFFGSAIFFLTAALIGYGVKKRGNSQKKETEI